MLKEGRYFEFYDLPVIADDSGLFVDALNGAPVFIQLVFQEKMQMMKKIMINY